jgi:formamidopyrimidine-DNA glycosylase
MPELPEVETIKRDLNELIIGKKILGITTDSPKQVQPSLALLKKAVLGETIKRFDRRAKLLYMTLTSGKILAFHLKMTGRLLVRRKGTKRDDWQHVVIKLKTPSGPGQRQDSKLKGGDLELRFCDLRKFGWVRLFKSKKELDELLTKFGPDALDFKSLKEFQEILSKSKRAIKLVIMDQGKIAGVGNIYASDALNLAKIKPRRPANKLSKNEAKILLFAIRKVLSAGIKYRGASDQYYLDALGHKGKYQEHFLTYNREGEKCFNCDTEIKKIKLGNRGTYYCPACQK